MAFPVLEETTTADSGSTAQSSITVNKPAGTQVDDLLILFVYNDPGTSSTPPFQTPSGFTQDYNVEGDTFADCSFGVFHRVADGTEGANFTITANDSARIGAVCFRVSNIDTASPIDVLGAETNQGTGTTHDHTSFNTGTDEVLVFGLGTATRGDRTFSISAGTSAGWSALTSLFNGVAGTDVSAWYATKTIATSGTLSPLMTVVSSGVTGSIQAQFSVAPGAGGGGGGGEDPGPPITGGTLEAFETEDEGGASTKPDMLDISIDLVEEMLSRVIAQDQPSRRPRLYAYICALGAGGKLLEQALRSVFFGLTYEGAVGRERDAWGAILQIDRGSFDEATYRHFQELRIYVATQPVSVPRCIRLLQEAFPGRTIAAAINLPNGAHFQITNGAQMSDAERAHMATLIRDYQPPGHMYYVGEVPNDPIRFEVTAASNESRQWANLVFGGR